MAEGGRLLVGKMAISFLENVVFLSQYCMLPLVWFATESDSVGLKSAKNKAGYTATKVACRWAVAIWGTKENDISLHLKMMDLFWKLFQRELLRFSCLLNLSWWDQHFGGSFTSYVNHKIWNCKNLWFWCFDNRSSFSCQI